MALDDNAQLALDELPDKGTPVMSNNKRFLDNFNRDISMWWVSNSSKVSLLRAGNTLKVYLNGAGGDSYECWGREFRISDFSASPVVKVRARFEGKTPPVLRLSLKDINSLDANFDAPTIQLKEGDYQDYYFNFKDRWKQGWPDEKNVDATAIKEISFFINPGTEKWTGTIYIDETEPVKAEDIPDKNGENTNFTPVNSANVNDTIVSNVKTPEKDTPQLIDDFNNEIYSWWVGSDKIKVMKEGEMLKVEVKGVGPGFENWGRGFKAIDFTKTPVVKVRMKASGEKSILLRVDIKDADGFVTNAKPNIIEFEPAPDFVNYYYDFTDRFEQKWPDIKSVDPSKITDLLFFINPGGELYSGTLFIDEISAISAEDYKNKK